MITSLDEWVTLLRHSHSAFGFPLVVGGVGMMLFGWRMWRVCVMLSYGLIGAILVAVVAKPADDQWISLFIGGAVLGLASYWPASFAVSLLGGLIGTGLVMYSIANMGISGTVLWTSGGAAMIVCTAFAFLNRQHVVIVVMAFLGAGLLTSGLAAWVMSYPPLYHPLRMITASSAIVLPFMVLVPTVVSSFYQAAEVRRLNASL